LCTPGLTTGHRKRKERKSWRRTIEEKVLTDGKTEKCGLQGDSWKQESTGVASCRPCAPEWSNRKDFTRPNYYRSNMGYVKQSHYRPGWGRRVPGV
jgi:hypothetical protein